MLVCLVSSSSFAFHFMWNIVVVVVVNVKRWHWIAKNIYLWCGACIRKAKYYANIFRCYYVRTSVDFILPGLLTTNLNIHNKRRTIRVNEEKIKLNSKIFRGQFELREKNEHELKYTIIFCFKPNHKLSRSSDSMFLRICGILIMK